LLGYLSGADKAYSATIRLGVGTATDDAEGQVTDSTSTAGIEEEAIRAGLRRLTGNIEQVPSSVSAIKVAGRRAYSRVRAGEEVSLVARAVTVSRLELLDLRRPSADTIDLDISVVCTSGTYIRAMARDLGAGLGVGGHLTVLRRTRVGPFSIAQARTLEEMVTEPISYDLADAIRQTLPSVSVDVETARALGYGQRVAAQGLAGVYGVFDPEGGAVALVEDLDGQARAVVGFT